MDSSRYAERRLKMKVQYTKDKKTALYNGEKFTRDEETGYYLSTRDIGGKRKRTIITRLD